MEMRAKHEGGEEMIKYVCNYLETTKLD